MCNLKNKLTLGIVVSALTILPTISSFGYERVQLTSRDPWATTKKAVKTGMCSVDGNVSKNSKKDVAFVPLYMGKDGKYHYDETNYRMWHRYEPDTNCPLFHSMKRKKGTKWLLQLNPYGVGDNGKGGVATGYIYVPRK